MTDSCIFTGNYQKYWKFKLAMTNSAKFAHYAHMGTKMQMVFGTTHECVQAALSGAVRASHGR
jgi:predicted aconitase